MDSLGSNMTARARSLVYRRTTRSVRPATDSQLVNNVLYLAEATHSTIADPFDVSSQRLYDLRLNLANGDELGQPINYVVEKGTWLIQGIQVRLVHERALLLAGVKSL
jgi:hypothetical protein